MSPCASSALARFSRAEGQARAVAAAGQAVHPFAAALPRLVDPAVGQCAVGPLVQQGAGPRCRPMRPDAARRGPKEPTMTTTRSLITRLVAAAAAAVLAVH